MLELWRLRATLWVNLCGVVDKGLDWFLIFGVIVVRGFVGRKIWIIGFGIVNLAWRFW